MDVATYTLIAIYGVWLPFWVYFLWKSNSRKLAAQAQRKEFEELSEMRGQLTKWLGVLVSVDKWHREHLPTHGWVGTCRCDLSLFYLWQWDQAMALMLFLGDDPWKVLQDSIDRVMSEEFPEDGQDDDDEDEDEDDEN